MTEVSSDAAELLRRLNKLAQRFRTEEATTQRGMPAKWTWGDAADMLDKVAWEFVSEQRRKQQLDAMLKQTEET